MLTPLPISSDGPLSDDRENAEKQWRMTSQHRPDWVDVYRASRTAEWRRPFVDALRLVTPFQTVLDLGCNCGATVASLAEVEPNVQVLGIDIGEAAIKAAKVDYPSHAWLCGSLVDWLPMMAARRFDVVTSCSTLCAITPDDIAFVLHCVMGVTDAVVLQEPSVNERHPVGRGNSAMPEWVHDYEGLFTKMGWALRHQAWQDILSPRPASVMVWRKR